MASITLDNRVIAYHAEFTKMLGNVNAGIFLSQLVYWQGKGRDPEGWIYKTQQEWYEETGLTRKGQETARKILKEAGILKEKLAGIPAKLHFLLDIHKLNGLLKVFREKTELLKSKKQTKLVCSASTNKFDQNGQTITENTTQITFVVEEDKIEVKKETNIELDKPINHESKKEDTASSPDFVEKVSQCIRKHIGISVPEPSIRSLLKCGNWDLEYIKEKIKELSGCRKIKSVTGLLRYALENDLRNIKTEKKFQRPPKKEKEAANSYQNQSERKKQLIKSLYMS